MLPTTVVSGAQLPVGAPVDGAGVHPLNRML
jgi:hypothetical protein